MLMLLLFGKYQSFEFIKSNIFSVKVKCACANMFICVAICVPNMYGCSIFCLILKDRDACKCIAVPSFMSFYERNRCMQMCAPRVCPNLCRRSM